MRVILLVLALIGSALALSPGNQYVYKYEGKIAMGIPEIRSRVAGTGVKCTVHIQVQNRDDVVFQLSDIEVGEFMGDVGCELQHPMPIKYAPLSGEGQILEEPYLAHLKKSEDDVMVVSKNDKEWMTNLRKSIVSLFLIEPIRSNFGGPPGKPSLAESFRRPAGSPPDAFSVEEPSIFGICTNDYTFVELNSSSPLPGRRERQGNDPRNFTLTRSFNFDRCIDMSVLQTTGLGNTTLAKENQFENLAARTSIMSANLTYQNSTYRLENSTVEGHYVLNPFGLEQDKLMSISNQTIYLVSQSPLTDEIHLPSSDKKIDSYAMEVASPYSRSAWSPTWVNFYSQQDPQYAPVLAESVTTGIPIKPDDIKKFKDALDKLLDAAATAVISAGKTPPPHQLSPFDTLESQLVTQMESAMSVSRGLDVKSLEQLFDQYYKDTSQKGPIKLGLLVDACAANGVGASVKMILNEIQQGRISPARAASVFFTFANNFAITPVISDITEFVKTLSLDQSPLMTSTVWINYASSLNKICLSSQRYHYTVPHQIFGSQACDVRSVVDGILPFFEDELEKTDEVWKQIILIHAIGNLGVEQILKPLMQIIHSHSHSQVRTAAIYSLVQTKLPEELKEPIMESLMPIVADIGENSYVRQAAIMTILSWKPSPSWYQRMAIATWREPSSDVASFVYSLLEGLSLDTDPAFTRQARIARFVLPLAKPYSPSKRFSNTFFGGRFVQQDILSSDYDFSILRDEQSEYPREAFSFIMNSFGGLQFSTIEASVSYVSGAVNNAIQEITKVIPEQWKSLIRSSSNRKRQSSLDDLKGRMTVRPGPEAYYSTFYLNLFDDLEYLVPVTEDVLSKAVGGLPQLLRSFSEDKAVHYTKFLNPGAINMYIASELGLPLLVKVSSPTISACDGQASLSVDGKHFTNWNDFVRARDVQAHLNSKYKFATKIITSIRALMPWAEKIVASGVETLKSVSLPADFRVNITKSSVDFRNISLHVVPTFQEEFPALHAHTIPFVVSKSMWPGQSPSQIRDMQLISISGGSQGVIEREVPLNQSLTGLVGKIRYEGDVPYPFTYGNLEDLARNPEKILELLTSPTSRMYTACGIVNFGSSPTKEIHASVAYKPEPSSFSLSSNLLLNGSETRYFESQFYTSSTPSGQGDQQQRVVYQLTTGRSPLPSYDSQPAVYSLQLDTKQPYIDSFESLEKALESKQIEIEAFGNLSRGTTSPSQEIARIDSKLDLTEVRRQRLLEELKSQCNYDPADPMVAFKTDPVYDKLTLNIQYQEPVPRVIQNMSYHIYDVIRGRAYPHIYFNYMDIQNTKDKIAVRGGRSLGSSRWEVRAELPTETVNFDYLRIPPRIDHIIPHGGLPEETHSTPTLLFESRLSSKCVITKNQVRTFDGYSYKFTPDYCDIYAVVDKRNAEAPVFMVDKDFNSGNLKGLIGSSGSGITIVFNSSKLFVDDKEMKLTKNKQPILLPNGAKFAEASKIANYVDVNVPGNFSVRLSDQKVYVSPHSNMRSLTAGLCGDFNGVTKKELVGPKNCLYTDPALYAAAWMTSNGAGCDYQHYRQEQAKVEQYQQNCPKATERPVSTVLPKIEPIPYDCIEYVYIIKKNGDAVCVTHNSVSICHPMCKLDFPRYYQEVYDCWPESDAPKEIFRYLKRGYIKHRISVPAAVQSAFRTEHAYRCSRK